MSGSGLAPESHHDGRHDGTLPTCEEEGEKEIKGSKEDSREQVTRSPPVIHPPLTSISSKDEVDIGAEGNVKFAVTHEIYQLDSLHDASLAALQNSTSTCKTAIFPGKRLQQDSIQRVLRWGRTSKPRTRKALSKTKHTTCTF